jgi:hypothetical protein
MTALFSRLKRRSAIALIAAYAVALQAIFTTLVPPSHAAGAADPFAAYCFGAGDAGLPASGAPGAPSPASGKMHCVFCGACAAGSFVLPLGAGLFHARASHPVARPLAAAIDRPVVAPIRSGPARAPPPTL